MAFLVRASLKLVREKNSLVFEWKEEEEEKQSRRVINQTNYCFNYEMPSRNEAHLSHNLCKMVNSI